MPPKKKEVIQEADTHVIEEEIVVDVKPIPKSKEVITVRCVRSELYHPYQKRWIPADQAGVEVVLDGWVDSQLQAGLVEKC